MWDVRAPAQESMVKVFECMHFDQVNQIEKINEEIFCSASNDGTVNVSDYSSYVITLRVY
jgi:hypothetical protein